MPSFGYALDVLIVLAFAVAGRASHEEGLTPAGVADTAWPFLLSWALARLAVGALRLRPESVRAGLVIWSSTVAGGMLLRQLTGDGTALPFVLVAAAVLGAGLLSWRLMLALARRRQTPTVRLRAGSTR